MRFQQHNPAGRYLMPSYGAMKNNGADDHNKHWRHNQMGWRDWEGRHGWEWRRMGEEAWLRLVIDVRGEGDMHTCGSGSECVERRG